MTQYIKAPFNFVPVSEKVFFPDWGNQISQDIPFEDGESGELELTITAHSPIFVRNGHTKQDAEEKNIRYKSFSRVGENDYFIPATSIKGAIRNVLEIMSFGKMRIDKQMKFSTREWDSPDIYNLKGNQKNIHCGWLSKSNNGYKIQDCGKPDRINHKRIDELLKEKGIKIQFESHFSKKTGVDITEEQKVGNQTFDPKTAIYKYALINYDLNLLSNLPFVTDEEFAAENQENRVKTSTYNSEYNGTIVFTGSPDTWVFPRKPKGGKFYEFVFPNIDGEILPISNETFNYFKFIYADSKDWKFWKDKVENRERMPVFFRLDNTGRNVKDFGLAFLYKLPFEKSPLELLSENHKYDDKSEKPYKPDLAECIFGYTTKKYSLKGRVQFGNATVQGKAIKEPETELLLGSPKPSYYPIYVEQNGENGKATEYNVYSSGKHISGWKRYPIRSQVWNNKSDDNPDLNTYFVPLAKGTTFKSRIRFHNLKQEEIGALLSAITFHNNETDYYHQIGLAKPYGYGKISISVSMFPTMRLSPKEYMSSFEETIVNDKEIFNGKLNWHDSEQLFHLFTMAGNTDVKMDELLKYMQMDTDKEKNEFLKAKEFKEYLDRYTSLSKEMKNPLSVYKSVKEQKEQEEFERNLAIENAKQDAILKKFQDAKQKEDEERQKRKETNQQEALAEGFITSIVDFSKRDSWDQLKKEVEVFICKIQKDNNYNRILKNNPNGILSDNNRDIVLNCVSKTYLASKEKAKWEYPFDKNSYLKKIAEWIGKDNTIAFYETLIKSKF